MRSFLALFFVCACACSSLKAQFYDQALGLRGGTTFSLSYKRFVVYYPRLQQAFEVLLSAQLDERRQLQNGFLLEGLYFVHADLGFDTGFSVFAGAGPFAGIYVETGRSAYFGGGITASLGIEYTFKFTPLSFGIDWKPFLGSPRSSILSGGLTLRYILPTTWQ